MLLFADTETTGIPDFKKPADDPSQPRVASVAMVLTTPDAARVLDTWYGLIRPDGWSIDGTDAGRINGLSDALLAAHGRPIRDALTAWNGFLDRGVTLVAHNVTFDAKMMRGGLRRVGMPDRYDDITTFCTMRQATDVCAIPSPRGRGYKWPNLGEALGMLCGAKLRDDAHDALFDALACRLIYRELMARQAVAERVGPAPVQTTPFPPAAPATSDADLF